MRLGDISPDVLTQLQNLPSSIPTTWDLARQWNLIPVSSSTWLTPAQLRDALTVPAATQAASSLKDWLNTNSTTVYVVAGALFVLALFGGRR